MIVDSTNPRIMADNIRELARNGGGGGSGSSGVSHYKVTSGAIEGTFAEVLADLTAGKLVCLDVYSDGILAVTYFRDGLFTSEEETLTKLGFYAIANKIQKGVLSSDGSFTLSRTYPLVVDYSTSEQDTGMTWNGKTVYQKTFTGNTGSSETTELLSGIDEIMDTRGYVIGDNYGSKYQIGVYRNSSFLCSAVNGENKLLLVRFGTAYSNKNYCITVQYTKVTVTETKKRKTTKGEN